MGIDTQAPVISKAGIVIISILLAIFLFSLFAMSTYAWWYPRWTDQLDAFAMMRLGDAVAEKAPLLVTYRSEKVQALDELPGWIGEAITDGEKESISRLELGSPRVLGATKEYECYSGDVESVKPGPWEKASGWLRRLRRRCDM